MPTFTTIAWETLIEPKVRDSCKTSFKSKQSTTKLDDGDEKEKKMKIKAPNHIYISPALYITPEPAPIPDSSSDPVSPSPYVVNHKRRGGRRSREAANHRVNGFEVQQKQKFRDGERNSGGGDDDGVISNVESALRLQQEVVGENILDAGTVEDRKESSVVGDDSMSVASSTELNDFGKQADSVTVVSNHGEFFDADEDFSDGAISIASPSCGPSIESELSATRLGLLEEIERRKTAEDSLHHMSSQWQRIANILSREGLTFPMPSTSTNLQLEIDSVEQFSQELVVARFVAEAMGKGQARAEAEIAAEEILESKDMEISRLRDRLQYYEAVNHEMSQRNQEVMEVARSQRQRKRNQRRWLWGCVGMSIVIGTSVIAYSYLPQRSEHQELKTSSDCSDASCAGSSKSA